MSHQQAISNLYGEEVTAWLVRYGYLHEGQWTIEEKDRLEAMQCAHECVALQQMTYGPDHVADAASKILKAHHALMQALDHIKPNPGPLTHYRYSSVTLPASAARQNVISLCERRKSYGKTRPSSKS